MTAIPKWGKKLARRVAKHLGYIVLPAWQDNIVVPRDQAHSFQAAGHLRCLFDLLKVDCVLDVGANLGQYRSFLRDQVGYAGLVISFEPIPDHVAILFDQARSDPNWQVEGLALGKTPGARTFNIMSDSQFSSFLAPSHEEVSLFHDLNKISRHIEAQVSTLDSVVPRVRRQFSTESIYLKLDTQGFDLEILKGARHVLGEVKALQFEASVRKLYEGAPRYREVIDYCEERGFLMSGIFPNNAGFSPVLFEFDCFMIGQKWSGIDAIATHAARLAPPRTAGAAEA